MPKKKKLPVKTKLLDSKTHLGVDYEVWNIEGKLTYKIKEGLPEHKFEADSRRAGTTQMKTHIKLMKEALEKDKEVEKQMETDQDIKDVDEFDDIFDFETEEEDTTEEEKPVVKATKAKAPKKAPMEAEGSESEALFDDSFEESTPPLEKGHKDGHETELPSSVPEEEVKDPKEEIKEAIIEPSFKGHVYPNTPVIEWDLSFVVSNGTFYGKIDLDTFVTIKRSRFAIISRNKFLEESRLKDLRVTKLKMRYVPVGMDKTLLLRFCLLGVTCWLKRKEGHIYLEPSDTDREHPRFVHKVGLITLDSRTMMLFTPKAEDKVMKGAKPVIDMTYPSADVVAFNGVRFMTDTYKNAVKIFENRLYEAYINGGNHMTIKDTESGCYVLVANAMIPDEDDQQDGRPEKSDEEE